jgi:hypothetical protein
VYIQPPTTPTARIHLERFAIGLTSYRAGAPGSAHPEQSEGRKPLADGLISNDARVLAQRKADGYDYAKEA